MTSTNKGTKSKIFITLLTLRRISTDKLSLTKHDFKKRFTRVHDYTYCTITQF